MLSSSTSYLGCRCPSSQPSPTNQQPSPTNSYASDTSTLSTPTSGSESFSFDDGTHCLSGVYRSSFDGRESPSPPPNRELRDWDESRFTTVARLISTPPQTPQRSMMRTSFSSAVVQHAFVPKNTIAFHSTNQSSIPINVMISDLLQRESPQNLINLICWTLQMESAQFKMEYFKYVDNILRSDKVYEYGCNQDIDVLMQLLFIKFSHFYSDFFDLYNQEFNFACVLIAAAYEGYFGIVRLLINKSPHLIRSKRDFAVLNHKYSYQKITALSAAAVRGHISIARFLIEKEAKIENGNEDENNPLSLMIQRGPPFHVHMAEFLIERKPHLIHIKDKYGRTPLHTAAELANVDAILFLCNPTNIQRIDINLPVAGPENEAASTNTALHLALYRLRGAHAQKKREDYLKIIEILSSHPEIDLNIKNNLGKSPLDFPLLKKRLPG